MNAWKEATETFKAAVAYTKKELVPILDRIKDLEARASIPGPSGEKGDPGQSGIPGLKGDPGPPGERGMDGVIGTKGENGDPGLNGKDGSPGMKGENGDPGLNGKDGSPGMKGENGDPGPSSERGERGEKGLDGKPGERGEKGDKGDKGDPGLNGKDGPHGKDGLPGLPGRDGGNGAKGEDGKSVTIEEVRGLFESEISRWALEFERRAHDLLQKAIDKIPAPIPGKDGINGLNGKDGANGKDGKDASNGLNGKDGSDGFGFDDLEILQANERHVIIRFAKDGRTKEFPLSFPILIDRGTYKAGMKFEKGDGATYAGSFWICQKDNPVTGPGDGPDWRLAVKRGRDSRSEQ